MNQKTKKRSQLGAIWFRFRKNKRAVIALVFVILIALIAICAPLIVSWEEATAQNVLEQYLHPSKEHWFGTDAFGRDLFARIIWGARYSLVIGIGSIVFSAIVGAIIGAISAYYGGAVDNIIMRILDVFMAIPPMLMSIVVVTALGNGVINLVIAMGLATLPQFARIMRSFILSVKSEEYIEAARCCGTSDARIIFKHIIPNCLGPMIVQTTLGMATNVITIAGLSYLGLGVAAPKPEWGAMVAAAKSYMRLHPYLIIYPGCSILITALSLNLLGDGLRDALDPKLKS